MNARRVVGAPALLALLVLTVAASCSRGDAAPDTSAAASAVIVGPENVVVVKAEEIRTGPTLSGAIEAERVATVRAEVPGAVLTTFAEPGQRVGAGAVLARIDDSAIRDQALSARAAVATAQNADDIAKRELERSEALLKAGAIAERDLERARNGALAAQTQLANAKAIAASAEKQLAKTRITAPFAGVVSARQVNAGDVVQPGGALFTVVDPRSMRLEASVPSEALSAVRVGAPVSFTVRGYPDERFEGRIERVSPTADPATRQVPIFVTIPNKQSRLVAGLFAEGRLERETRTGLVVPQTAVNENSGAPWVLKVQDGKAQKVDVTLGLRDEQTERVEIARGVVPGDLLLVGAAQGMTPGTPLRIRAQARFSCAFS